jgi:hypothetical protein
VTAGTNLGICIGQLLSNAAIKGFGERPDTWAYRAPFALQWLFVLLIIIGLPFAPESPWFHIRKNQLSEARKCLYKLYGETTDLDAKLAMMVRTVNEDVEVSQGARWAMCFRGTNWTRTMISVMVFACQHLSGIVFVLGFSTYFFQLAGIDESDSFNLGVGVTACGVVGCIISWSLINSFGRRKLFILGMVGMTIVLLLMGILDEVHTGAARWVQASCTIVYALFYQATIGPLAFAILGETPTAALRAKTVGLATAMQAVFGTLMNVVVPYLVNPDKAVSAFPFRYRGESYLLTFHTEPQGQSRLHLRRPLRPRHSLVILLHPRTQGPHLRRDRLAVPESYQPEEDGWLCDRR